MLLEVVFCLFSFYSTSTLKTRHWAGEKWLGNYYQGPKERSLGSGWYLTLNYELWSPVLPHPWFIELIHLHTHQKALITPRKGYCHFCSCSTFRMAFLKNSRCRMKLQKMTLDCFLTFENDPCAVGNPIYLSVWHLRRGPKAVTLWAAPDFLCWTYFYNVPQSVHTANMY